MNASLNRRRMIAGAMVIVSIFWCFDMIGNSSSPSEASAAQLALSTPAPAVRTVDPADRSRIEQFLFFDTPPPPAPTFERVTRDPFAPPLITSASTESAPSAAGGASRPEAPSVPARPYAERHQLQGVVFGPPSLALIDGAMRRIGDTIDGGRLVAIERSRVVIELDDERVCLRLATPGNSEAKKLETGNEMREAPGRRF